MAKLNIDEELVRQIVTSLLEKNINNNDPSIDKNKRIPIEASGRHAHLSHKDVERLFGKNYRLTPKDYLSQPGEFLCQEKIKLVTGKSEIENVSIIGPTRDQSQIEISITDARKLGLKPVIRLSGDLEGAENIFIVANNNMIESNKSVIVAKNHIHMKTSDAKHYQVKNGQRVDINVNSERPIVFKDVIIRVSDNYKLAMHIDYDEANACNLTSHTYGEIL